MPAKTYKCAFKNCQHESRDVIRDEAVKVGNRYMHIDCAKNIDYLKRTRDLYYEKISNTVVFSQLVNVINNLFVQKSVDPEYMYFALSYAVNNKIPVRSPYGLHYLVDNDRIKKAWKAKQAAKIADQIKKEAEETDIEGMPKNDFSYTSVQETGFGGILKGGI